MRLGILSDTHDRFDRTIQAVAALKASGAQALIHCGDLTSPEIVHICGQINPSYFVLGNNDFDETELRAAIDAVGGTCLGRGGLVTLDGKRIGATHGDSPMDFRHLLRVQPDYLLFGHTHVPMDERDGPTRQINPGALHRASRHTFALLDFDEDRVQFQQVVDSRKPPKFGLPRYPGGEV